MGNEDSRDAPPWSHDSAVGKLNATKSISGSTKRRERKRKQQVATVPKDTKYQRNSSKKINRRGRNFLPGCDAGVWDSRRKRGREVGFSVWAGKRTHLTNITHAILNATPRGTGSVRQASFQCEQLLQGSNGFEFRMQVFSTALGNVEQRERALSGRISLWMQVGCDFSGMAPDGLRRVDMPRGYFILAMNYNVVPLVLQSSACALRIQTDARCGQCRCSNALTYTVPVWCLMLFLICHWTNWRLLSVERRIAGVTTLMHSRKPQAGKRDAVSMLKVSSTKEAMLLSLFCQNGKALVR